MYTETTLSPNNFFGTNPETIEEIYNSSDIIILNGLQFRLLKKNLLLFKGINQNKFKNFKENEPFNYLKSVYSSIDVAASWYSDLEAAKLYANSPAFKKKRGDNPLVLVYLIYEPTLLFDLSSKENLSKLLNLLNINQKLDNSGFYETLKNLVHITTGYGVNASELKEQFNQFIKNNINDPYWKNTINLVNILIIKKLDEYLNTNPIDPNGKLLYDTYKNSRDIMRRFSITELDLYMINMLCSLFKTLGYNHKIRNISISVNGYISTRIDSYIIDTTFNNQKPFEAEVCFCWAPLSLKFVAKLKKRNDKKEEKKIIERINQYIKTEKRKSNANIKKKLLCGHCYNLTNFVDKKLQVPFCNIKCQYNYYSLKNQ
jgi:hypothetical protein